MPPVPSSDREDASEAVAEENAAAAANCSPMDEKEAAKIIAITCAPLERASEREREKTVCECKKRSSIGRSLYRSR